MSFSSDWHVKFLTFFETHRTTKGVGCKGWECISISLLDQLYGIWYWRERGRKDWKVLLFFHLYLSRNLAADLTVKMRDSNRNKSLTFCHEPTGIPLDLPPHFYYVCVEKRRRLSFIKTQGFPMSLSSRNSKNIFIFYIYSEIISNLIEKLDSKCIN